MIRSGLQQRVCIAHVYLVWCVDTAQLEIKLLKFQDGIVVSTKNVGKDRDLKQIKMEDKTTAQIQFYQQEILSLVQLVHFLGNQYSLVSRSWVSIFAKAFLVDSFQHTQGLSYRYAQKLELENMCYVTSSILLTRQYFLFKYIFQFLSNSALSVPNDSFFSPPQEIVPEPNSSHGQTDSSFACKAWFSLTLKVISYLLWPCEITYNRNYICAHVTFSCAAGTALGGLNINTDKSNRA